MAQFIDQEINGYKVQKAIGEGKFSTVYRAQNSEQNTIALKKIKREKCLKEVKLMQPLDHPNIIKFLDSFIYNNELIIATEWAEKGDLKKLIKSAQQDDTPFDELTIWNYILQIASALNHMHEKRIMHRDLKPANIFISSDGTLKVGDLGLGRIFSSETIEAYSKVGTPLYMSPELLQGEGYDMKSDTWSLGCIAYEMCEFKSPFKQSEKMSLIDLFNNITKGEFKPISNRYTQGLRDLINGMIVVDPTKRLDAETVYIRARENYSLQLEQQKNPLIVNILMMEDIYEKLTLVQYQEYFCKPLKKQPVNKFYFALDTNVNAQSRYFYFVELCYWLMSLPKQKKNKAVQPIKLNYNSVEDTAKKLLQDIKSWGIKLPEQLTWHQIASGTGDMVCFILNDLLNRELIRINFKFENPKYGKDIENSGVELGTYEKLEQVQVEDDDYEEDFNEEDSVEQDDLTQSIIFYHKKYNSEQIDYNQVPQEKKVLETQVASSEWMKEFNRIEKDLTKYELNLKTNKTYLKDYEKTTRQIKKQSQLFTMASEYFRSQRVQDIQQEWIDILDQLSKLEQRCTEQIPQSIIETLNNNRQLINDNQLKVEAIQRDIQSKINEEQFIEVKLQEIQNKTTQSYDYRQEFKSLINKLKNDIKIMDIKKGLLQQQLLRKVDKKDVESDIEL